MACITSSGRDFLTMIRPRLGIKQERIRKLEMGYTGKMADGINMIWRHNG